eukprot:9189120-Pyramimonas_sp.AAC.1
MCTHRDKFYDPVFDATVQLAHRYCCWVWGGRAKDSDMRCVWEQASKALLAAPHWFRVRAPVGSVMLSLQR